MGIWKRAFIYILRNKKQSIILISIIYIISFLFLLGGSLLIATKNEIGEIQEKLGTSFRLKANLEDRSLYREDENSFWYTGPLVTFDIVDEVITLEHVTAYFPNETISAWTNLKLKPASWTDSLQYYLEHPEDLQYGKMPMEYWELWSQVPGIIPCTRGEFHEYFRIGVCEIVEGRNIVEEDCNKAVISIQMAKRNQLKTGDFFYLEEKEGLLSLNPEQYGKTIGEPVRVEIVGLFDIRFEQEQTGYTMENQLIENTLFIDQNTKNSLYNMGGVNEPQVGFTDVTVFVDSPQYLNKIMKQVDNMDSTEGLLIEADDSSYQNSVIPLKRLGRIVAVLMITGILVCVVILLLLMNLWIKKRRKEIGVLRSVGVTCKEVTGQIIIEGLLIVSVAVVIGITTYIPTEEQVFFLVEAQLEPVEEQEFEEIYISDNWTGLPIINKTVMNEISFDKGISIELILETIVGNVVIVIIGVVNSISKILKKSVCDLL